MNITVNVDDTKLSELLRSGMDSIDGDTIKDIAKKAISEVFHDTEMAQRIILRKEIYGSAELAPWVRQLLQDSVTQDDIDEFKNIVFTAIREHAYDMVVEALAKTLASNMFAYDNQRNFASELMTAIENNRRQ